MYNIIVHGFRPETGFRQNIISSERASKGEKNGANFSSIAPSSEEL